MIYNLAHNGNKLITFTIDGTTYQAIDGMTWEEWVNSEYNTRSFLLSGEGVYYKDPMIIYVAYQDISLVSKTETIRANYAYTRNPGGVVA